MCAELRGSPHGRCLVSMNLSVERSASIACAKWTSMTFCAANPFVLTMKLLARPWLRNAFLSQAQEVRLDASFAARLHGEIQPNWFCWVTVKIVFLKFFWNCTKIILTF